MAQQQTLGSHYGVKEQKSAIIMSHTLIGYDLESNEALKGKGEWRGKETLLLSALEQHYVKEFSL